MEKLNKIDGKYYTQNDEGLSIEQRVFFREGIVANVNDFRIATEEEISKWQEYKELQDKEIIN